MLVIAAGLGVLFWVAEGFGGIFTGQGTDPNTGPLLVLLAACYWQSPRRRSEKILKIFYLNESWRLPRVQPSAGRGDT